MLADILIFVAGMLFLPMIRRLSRYGRLWKKRATVVRILNYIEKEIEKSESHLREDSTT